MIVGTQSPKWIGGAKRSRHKLFPQRTETGEPAVDARSGEGLSSIAEAGSKIVPVPYRLGSRDDVGKV